MWDVDILEYLVRPGLEDFFRTSGYRRFSSGADRYTLLLDILGVST